MVKINGTEVSADNMTVAEYLRSAGYDMSRIAVEKDGTIVPRSKYETESLNDGASVEIVSFVGGG